MADRGTARLWLYIALLMLVTSTFLTTTGGGASLAIVPTSAGIHPSTAPSLTLYPANGTIGSVEQVTGLGFSPSSTVTLTFAGVPMNSTCATDPNGSFPGTSGTACTFTIPDVPGGAASVVASTTGTTLSATLNVGGTPVRIAYDSGLDELFVTNHGSDNVSVISDSNDSVVATIGVGSGPEGLAYDAGQHEVFVTNFYSDNLSVILDSNNTAFTSIGVGGGPWGVVYDSGQGEVFVTNYYWDTVSVISDSNDSVVASVGVGSNPLGIAYDPGLGEVFVVNSGSGTVSVISDSNNSVVATIYVGGYPRSIAYDSGVGEVFVSSYYSSTVAAILVSNDTVVATVSVGSYPDGVAYDPSQGEIFVTNDGSDNVSVISDVNDTVVSTVAVGSYPKGIAYDPGREEVFVANSGSNNVSIVTSDATATGTFTVTSHVTVAGSADVGQNISIDGNGFGVSAQITTFALGSYPLGCSSASTGTCSGGVLTTAPSGYLAATFIVPSVSASGTYAVSVADSVGNSGSASLSVDTDPIVTTPEASVGSVDLGQSTTFNVTASFGTGIYTYLWSGLPAGCSGNRSVVSCTPTSAGTSSIKTTVTDSNHFAVTSGPLSFVTYADPSVTTPKASAGSLDLGQSVSYSITASYGSGSYTYAWKGLPAGCSGSHSSVSCVPTANGTFSISVTTTDSNDYAVTSGTLSFVIYADPIVTAPQASLASVDLGQSVKITTTVSAGTGSYTFVWKGLPDGCSGHQKSLRCTATAPGSFMISVTVTDTNDFTVNSSALSFVVYADPTVSAPRPSSVSVDLGQTVVFNVTAGSGTGVYAFDWSGLPTGCSGNQSSVNCTPSASGHSSISVTVTDSNGMAVTSPALHFVVYPRPGLSAVGASRASVDLGQNVTFSVTASFGTGTYTYEWLGLPAGCSGNLSSVPCTPTVVGPSSISVKVTDSTGTAVTSNATSFEVFADPTVSVTANRVDLDAGTSVTLIAAATLGSGGYNYSWAELPTGCSGSAGTITCSPTVPGNYSVSVTIIDSNSFSVQSAAVRLAVANPLSATISATPASPASGASVTFSALVSGGTGPLTYAWKFGDGSGGVGPTVVHTFTTSGNYSVLLWVNDSSGVSVLKGFDLKVSNLTTVLPSVPGVPKTSGVPLTTILRNVLILIAVAALLVTVYLEIQRPRGGRPAVEESPNEGSPGITNSAPPGAG